MNAISLSPNVRFQANNPATKAASISFTSNYIAGDEFISAYSEEKLIDEVIKIFEDPEKSSRLFTQIISGQYENKQWKKLGDNILYKPDFTMSLMKTCVDRLEESGQPLPKELKASLDYTKRLMKRPDIQAIIKRRKEFDNYQGKINKKNTWTKIFLSSGAPMALAGLGGVTGGIPVLPEWLAEPNLAFITAFAGLVLSAIGCYGLNESAEASIEEQKPTKEILETKARALEGCVLREMQKQS
ncbi:MAG: hypothetical protein A2Y25_11180 [Candidatus Melainabacteria bacterium GWF2_37_15]|nr:MAG: hypothetical protein A2Y25_11180 [Candidatus Melainabacteria bacterium GWF2_37_15]